VLYPAELRARFSLGIFGLRARTHSGTGPEGREERFSYPLRPRLASARSASGGAILGIDFGISLWSDGPGDGDSAVGLGPGPFIADAEQFHRAVRDRDPEGRADGAFDQMDIAAMGADQFGRDRKAQPAAAGPT
jgi:hypothetical protein